MLTDILLGVAVSLSFVLGGLLYILTKEEVDALRIISFERLIYMLAIPLGIFLAIAIQTSLKIFAALTIFLICLASESLAYRNKDRKYVAKQSIKHTVIFLIMFIMFYSLIGII